MARVVLLALMAAVAWFLQSSPLSDIVLPQTSASVQSDSAFESEVVAVSVLPSAPLGISLPALGVNAGLYPGGIDTDVNGWLDPVDNRPAWWVRTAMPTTQPGGGTTMILGHNLGDGSTPFSRLDELSLGDEVTVWTQNGVIRYGVQEIRPIGRLNLSDDEYLMADVPGRLLLVTCRTEGNLSTNDNVVVVAQLVE